MATLCCSKPNLRNLMLSSHLKEDMFLRKFIQVKSIQNKLILLLSSVSLVRNFLRVPIWRTYFFKMMLGTLRLLVDKR
jgi:hypothetical protein